MNYIDCHTHSLPSPDADFPVMEMCEKAISLGLSAYAITDHVEACHFYSKENYDIIAEENPLLDYDYQKYYLSSIEEVTRTKELLKGKLNLICGVELGQCMQDIKASEIVYSDKRVDFIIGSLHKLKGKDDFAFIEYKNRDVNQLLNLYFTEIHEMCRLGKFDVLGHLTYTLRYMEGEQGIKIDLTPFDEIINESFKLLSHRGMGIEINTSGCRQKYGKPFPDLKYVEMFKQAGGEILSIGSDAHCPDDIGKNIGDGIEIARQAGFKYLAYYQNRKPEFIKI